MSVLCCPRAGTGPQLLRRLTQALGRLFFSADETTPPLQPSRARVNQQAEALLDREQPDTAPPVQVLPPFRQVDTLAALSDAVGFPVTEPAALPFDLVNTTYTAYDEGTAEITYTGSGGQTATYRQSRGSEGNSGDYNLYPDTQTLPEQNATLKGQDGLYTLALWTDDTYTYSLRLSSGLSADA